jgi:hypothetical protein
VIAPKVVDTVPLEPDVRSPDTASARVRLRRSTSAPSGLTVRPARQRLIRPGTPRRIRLDHDSVIVMRLARREREPTAPSVGGMGRQARREAWYNVTMVILVAVVSLIPAAVAS